MVSEQAVADKVKVAYQRHVATQVSQSLGDFWDCLCCVIVVHCDPNDFTAGVGEEFNLVGRLFNVGGIRVGHGLHDDWVAPSDGDVTDHDAMGLQARRCSFFDQFKHASIHYRLQETFAADQTCDVRKRNYDDEREEYHETREMNEVFLFG